MSCHCRSVTASICLTAIHIDIALAYTRFITIWYKTNIPNSIVCNKTNKYQSHLPRAREREEGRQGVRLMRYTIIFISMNRCALGILLIFSLCLCLSLSRSLALSCFRSQPPLITTYHTYLIMLLLNFMRIIGFSQYQHKWKCGHKFDVRGMPGTKTISQPNKRIKLNVRSEYFCGSVIAMFNALQTGQNVYTHISYVHKYIHTYMCYIGPNVLSTHVQPLAARMPFSLN